MQIDFFEEFPSAESLAPARLWPHPCRVYLAARDLLEFNRYAALLQKIQPRAHAAFWPILPSTYWVSPFTPAADLVHLRDTLAQSPALDVLLDLELPLLSGKRSRFFTGLPGFFRGKRLIREILSLKHRFLLAVYPAAGRFTQGLLYALGIDHPEHESCVMYYSSMMPAWLLRQAGQALHKRARAGRRTAGLGCLAPGIFGTEPVITPEALARDLDFCRQIGIHRIVLFRLGGLKAELVGLLEQARAAAAPEARAQTRWLQKKVVVDLNRLFAAPVRLIQ